MKQVFGIRGAPRLTEACPRHEDKARLTETRIYILWVRPCVTAKLPVLGPWFWNLILLNLAAASCYLHGKVLAAAGSESFMVEKSIADSGARAEPLQAAAQSVATGILTVLLWLADFSVQRLHGFRQVVQHAQWHCKSINFQLIREAVC